MQDIKIVSDFVTMTTKYKFKNCLKTKINILILIEDLYIIFHWITTLNLDQIDLCRIS